MKIKIFFPIISIFITSLISNFSFANEDIIFSPQTHLYDFQELIKDDYKETDSILSPQRRLKALRDTFEDHLKRSDGNTEKAEIARRTFFDSFSKLMNFDRGMSDYVKDNMIPTKDPNVFRDLEGRNHIAFTPKAASNQPGAMIEIIDYLESMPKPQGLRENLIGSARMLPGEYPRFMSVMWAVTYMNCKTRWSNLLEFKSIYSDATDSLDPMCGDHFFRNLADPVGWFGFYGFVVANHSVSPRISNALIQKLKNTYAQKGVTIKYKKLKALQTMIQLVSSGIGMTAGLAMSDYVHQMKSNPNVKKCFADVEKKTWFNEACMEAFKEFTLINRDSRDNMIISVASLLTGFAGQVGASSGFLYALEKLGYDRFDARIRVIGYATRKKIINGTAQRVAGVVIQVARKGIGFAKYSASTFVFLAVDHFMTPIITKQYHYVRRKVETSNSYNRLATSFLKLEQTNFVDLPTQSKKPCITFNTLPKIDFQKCENPIDFQESLNEFNLAQRDWREYHLISDAKAAISSWEEKWKSFSINYQAGKFAIDYIAKYRRDLKEKLGSRLNPSFQWGYDFRETNSNDIFNTVFNPLFGLQSYSLSITNSLDESQSKMVLDVKNLIQNYINSYTKLNESCNTMQKRQSDICRKKYVFIQNLNQRYSTSHVVKNKTCTKASDDIRDFMSTITLGFIAPSESDKNCYANSQNGVENFIQDLKDLLKINDPLILSMKFYKIIYKAKPLYTNEILERYSPVYPYYNDFFGPSETKWTGSKFGKASLEEMPEEDQQASINKMIIDQCQKVGKDFNRICNDQSNQEDVLSCILKECQITQITLDRIYKSKNHQYRYDTLAYEEKSNDAKNIDDLTVDLMTPVHRPIFEPNCNKDELFKDKSFLGIDLNISFILNNDKNQICLSSNDFKDSNGHYHNIKVLTPKLSDTVLADMTCSHTHKPFVSESKGPLGLEQVAASDGYASKFQMPNILLKGNACELDDIYLNPKYPDHHTSNKKNRISGLGVKPHETVFKINNKSYYGLLGALIDPSNKLIFEDTIESLTNYWSENMYKPAFIVAQKLKQKYLKLIKNEIANLFNSDGNSNYSKPFSNISDIKELAFQSRERSNSDNSSMTAFNTLMGKNTNANRSRDTSIKILPQNLKESFYQQFKAYMLILLKSSPKDFRQSDAENYLNHIEEILNGLYQMQSKDLLDPKFDKLNEITNELFAKLSPIENSNTVRWSSQPAKQSFFNNIIMGEQINKFTEFNAYALVEYFEKQLKTGTSKEELEVSDLQDILLLFPSDFEKVALQIEELYGKYLANQNKELAYQELKNVTSFNNLGINPKDLNQEWLLSLVKNSLMMTIGELRDQYFYSFINGSQFDLENIAVK